MDDFPKGWIKTKLPEIADIIMGQSPPSSTYNIKGEGIPFFQGKAEFGTLYPKEIKYCVKPQKIAEAGDILISVRAPVGPTNLCKERSCIGRGLAALRTRKTTISKYLLYHFRNIESWLSSQGTGSTFTAISKSDLEDIDVLIAPLFEQHRIVAKLEKLLAKIETSQERLNKIPSLLKRFRQSVLAAACSGRLTANLCKNDPETQARIADTNDFPDVPSSWHWDHIAGLFKVETGTTPPKKDPANYSHAPTDCPFFKPTDLDAGANVQKGREWLSKKGERFSRIVPPFTVCVTSIGATIGKTGLLQVRGATNQQINAILPSESILPLFTFFFCCSPYFQHRIIEESSSTTLPIINKGRFEKLEFPIPPFAEQQEIVRRVEALFKIADQIEERYQKAKAHIDKLTQSILAKAFRGELVPQDPTDEPISILLRKIEESRQTIYSCRKSSEKKKRS